MKMIRPVLALIAFVALAPIDATGASAQNAPCRPWCVHYGGGARGGGTNCGFISFEQCMWTAQGTDSCVPNSFCPPQPGARGGPPGYDSWGQGGGRRRH